MKCKSLSFLRCIWKGHLAHTKNCNFIGRIETQNQLGWKRTLRLSPTYGYRLQQHFCLECACVKQDQICTHLEIDSPSHHITGKFKAVEPNGSKTRTHPCLHPQLLWHAGAEKPWAAHMPKRGDSSYSAPRILG